METPTPLARARRRLAVIFGMEAVDKVDKTRGGARVDGLPLRGVHLVQAAAFIDFG